MKKLHEKVHATVLLCKNVYTTRAETLEVLESVIQVVAAVVCFPHVPRELLEIRQ